MTVGALAVFESQYPMGPGGNEPRLERPRSPMYEAVAKRNGGGFDSSHNLTLFLQLITRQPSVPLTTELRGLHLYLSLVRPFLRFMRLGFGCWNFTVSRVSKFGILTATRLVCKLSGLEARSTSVTPNSPPRHAGIASKFWITVMLSYTTREGARARH